jgi:hypothetical protein
MECSIVIESVEIIDNKWGDCLCALQLLCSRVNPAHATEFMRHP